MKTLIVVVMLCAYLFIAGCDSDSLIIGTNEHTRLNTISDQCILYEGARSCQVDKEFCKSNGVDWYRTDLDCFIDGERIGEVCFNGRVCSDTMVADCQMGGGTLDYCDLYCDIDDWTSCLGGCDNNFECIVNAKQECMWSNCPTKYECEELKDDFYSDNPQYDCTNWDIIDCLRTSVDCYTGDDDDTTGGGWDEGCNFDSICDTNEICVDNQCVDLVCDAGYVAYNGECKKLPSNDKCTTNDDCNDNQFCNVVAGVKVCQDLDCKGMVAEDHKCVQKLIYDEPNKLLLYGGFAIAGGLIGFGILPTPISAGIGAIIGIVIASII